MGKIIISKKLSIVLFKIWNIYKIDMIAIRNSTHEWSWLFINASFAADIARLTKLGPKEASSMVKNTVQVLYR